MKTAALLLVVIASLTGYAAAADEQDADPLAEPMQRARTLLAARKDADSLAAAAVLTFIADRAGAEQLLARAAAAPKRPDLLWLQAQMCKEVPDCDRKPIDSQLRALDPDNGVTWLTALADARKDAAEIDRLLGQIAGSKKVDLYWNSLLGHLSAAVVATNALTPSQSVATMTGIISAFAIPPFAGTVSPCRDAELFRPGRRARCQGVARALQQGDTAIAEMVGNGMATRLWPDGSPEVRAALESRRTFAWRTSISSEHSARLLEDEAATRKHLERLTQYRREQEVIVAELVADGRNPTPPAGWQPPSPPSAPGPAAR